MLYSILSTINHSDLYWMSNQRIGALIYLHITQHIILTTFATAENNSQSATQHILFSHLWVEVTLDSCYHPNFTIICQNPASIVQAMLVHDNIINDFSIYWEIIFHVLKPTLKFSPFHVIVKTVGSYTHGQTLNWISHHPLPHRSTLTYLSHFILVSLHPSLSLSYGID